jgi:hypothetical protein
MTLSVPAPANRLDGARRSVDELLRLAVTTGCAAATGVHLGIVPEHLHEHANAEAVAFVASSAVLATLALLVAREIHEPWATAFAATFLAAVAGAYLLSRTVGLPFLVGEPEPFDVTGLVTFAAELTSAAAGIALLLRIRKDHR